MFKVNVLLIVFFVMILCGFKFNLINFISCLVDFLINFLCLGVIVKIVLFLGKVSFNVLVK